MLTTPLRQLIGGRYRVETFCVEMLVYVDFSGLRNDPPFRLLEQSTLLSGGTLGRRSLFQDRFGVLCCLVIKGIPCFPGFGQNHDAAQLEQNPVANSNSKHIDVRHHRR